MDAIKLLTEDHRTVEALFEKFEKARGNAPRQAIVAKICQELTIHTMIEEEIFYPAFEGKIDEDKIREAYVEHDAAKVIIRDLGDDRADEDYYDAKVKVLSEEIEHHVEEEEKRGSGLFSQARKTDVDLDALGEQLAARKAELMQAAKAGTLPTLDPRTIDAN